LSPFEKGGDERGGKKGGMKGGFRRVGVDFSNQKKNTSN